MASRWQRPAPVNELTRLRRDLAAAGVALLDLADTNPTRHGLGSPAALAVVAAAAARAGRYDPDPRGPLAAREALAARFGGSPEDYWLTASTSEAYAWLFALLGNPGDAVATPTPGYPLVEPLARYAHLTTAPYPLHYLHPYGWTYDLDRLETVLARPDVKALAVVNPGNPTGAYVGPAGAAIADLAASHGVPVIADEVFFPYLLEQPIPVPVPVSRCFSGEVEQGDGDTGTLGMSDLGAATVSGPVEIVRSSLRSHGARPPGLCFTLDGLSKLLCAPGFKLGWIRVTGVAAEVAAVRPVLDEIADTFLPASAVMALALPGLLDLADGVVAATRARLWANLATLDAALPPTARRRRAEGGWMALVDLPWTADTDPAVTLLQDHHVAVHPGWFYDLPDRACVALSLLAEPDRFAAGVTALAAALGGAEPPPAETGAPATPARA
ncbi:MAG: pyridoxal phosphate-dependent aminotransferase [Propionibacteriaceae bacterium]|jgi:aspartate/methionine/tyrosine aminotransferase|nr:pyridoxal phosphate-dependent aminotransferase [Propionibacteriaceae bacterium]